MYDGRCTSQGSFFNNRQAEVMELKASRSRDAEAVVVEARLVQGQGPVATVVAKRGTLRPGLPIVVGNEWGKVGPRPHVVCADRLL